jgi:hypothetical protein
MAITLTPSVAEPRAKIDAIRVDVAGASPNDVADYDPGAYPSQAEIRCYLAFVLAGADEGKSYVFAVGQDGEHVFNNYIFPTDGSWSIELRRADDDSVLATEAITVT